MKVLLDENFPLPLLDVLRADGVEAEHIITLDLRGISDMQIRARLDSESLLFLTQDTEFLTGAIPLSASVLVSRLRQSRPLLERLETWRRAVRDVLARTAEGPVFELTDNGTLAPWLEG